MTGALSPLSTTDRRRAYLRWLLVAVVFTLAALVLMYLADGGLGSLATKAAGCALCGCPTSRRLSRDCELAERWESEFDYDRDDEDGEDDE